MTTEIRTAKIYQFPLRPRPRARGNAAHSAGPITDLPAAHAPSIVSGSGWYHDAAIEEAKRTEH